eukprot:CAMPEP_0172501972 /NCGR_PEP_ID=MMETSP1066-20121228/155399_1 /TAXON_ID=671091 /ORGANISM="Coscinodiscus wailesii, Strain CCMP2513" /LENGTH=303 /DNA_ID=CAMNT_0013277055 /DNA_START=57 /DNA_END=966 /DNA_ORIENTATION=+
MPPPTTTPNTPLLQRHRADHLHSHSDTSIATNILRLHPQGVTRNATDILRLHSQPATANATDILRTHPLPTTFNIGEVPVGREAEQVPRLLPPIAPTANPEQHAPVIANTAPSPIVKSRHAPGRAREANIPSNLPRIPLLSSRTPTPSTPSSDSNTRGMTQRFGQSMTQLIDIVMSRITTPVSNTRNAIDQTEIVFDDLPNFGTSRLPIMTTIPSEQPHENEPTPMGDPSERPNKTTLRMPDNSSGATTSPTTPDNPRVHHEPVTAPFSQSPDNPQVHQEPATTPSKKTTSNTSTTDHTGIPE